MKPSRIINRQAKRSGPQRTHVVVIALFVMLIVLPAVANVFSHEESFAMVEKRLPAPFPNLPRGLKEAKDFPGEVEAYLNDHFGFRSDLIALNSLVHSWLDVSGSPLVLMGKNGWLFLAKDHNIVEQYRGVETFTDEELEDWVWAMRLRRDWLAQKGIPFILVVAPNKHTIYSEYLPDFVNRVGPVTRLDQLAARLKKEPDFDYVDLRAPLLEAKGFRRVYHKTDSHWNPEGAFIGYYEIMKRVKNFFPSIQVLKYDDFDRVRSVKRGAGLSEMLNLSWLHREEVVDLRPRFASRIIRKENPEGQGSWPMVAETNLKDQPTALIFGDSFVNGLRPYFMETFGRSIFAHHRVLSFRDQFIEKYQPDIVIYEIVERAIQFKPRNPEWLTRQSLEKSRVTGD